MDNGGVHKLLQPVTHCEFFSRPSSLLKVVGLEPVTHWPSSAPPHPACVDFKIPSPCLSSELLLLQKVHVLIPKL